MVVKLVKGSHPLSVHAIWLVILLIMAGASRYWLPAPCVFHQITGLPCLSCGTWRAAGAFFERDFLGMFYYNPLIVAAFLSLSLFSLFKLAEYIFSFRLKVSIGRRGLLTIRMAVFFLITANWLFLIITGR
jgi:hypothetical protein